VHVYSAEMCDQLIQYASVNLQDNHLTLLIWARSVVINATFNTFNVYTFDVLTILYASLFGLREFLFHLRFNMHNSSMEAYIMWLYIFAMQTFVLSLMCALLDNNAKPIIGPMQWTRRHNDEENIYFHNVSFLVLLLSNTFKLFGFPIFRFWTYLMTVFPETRRAHKTWYLRFHCPCLKNEKVAMRI
jgi:hypothetical protein